jgi:Asp-tRNA(Asn)/Glu-tRNA(Gln) amidotransferase C subunit
MGKEMTLDVLSSIKGAKPSKVVEDLFEAIKKGHVTENAISSNNSIGVTLEELRADKAILSSETERNLIIENFPNTKDNFLVVPKVIEE